MIRSCEQCAGKVPTTARQDSKFCSSACRQKAYRERRRPLPEAMTSLPRWVRHDEDKRPLTIFGSAASVTDSRTWTTYAKAKASGVGAGLGLVLGGGIGCVDLDGAIDAAGRIRPVAAQIVRDHPDAVLVEVSRSGRGLHIFVPMAEGRGSVRTVDGQTIETYPPNSGRYIAVTGRRL